MEGTSLLKELRLRVQAAGTVMEIETIVVVVVIVTATVVTIAAVGTMVVISVEAVAAEVVIASNVASLDTLQGNAPLMMVAGGIGMVAGTTSMVAAMVVADMGPIVVVIATLGAVMVEAAMVEAVTDTIVTSLVLMNAPAKVDTDLDVCKAVISGMKANL